MSLHRREIVRSSLVAAGVSIAGCQSVEVPWSVNGNSSASRSSALDRLTFDAAVDSQASAESPPRISARLTNPTERTLEFTTGTTIVPIHDAGRVESVLLYPDEYIGPNEDSKTRNGDCWRFTGDDLLVQDEAVSRELAPGASYTETYGLYTVGSETPCLPAGEYRFTDEIWQSEERLALVIDVSIDEGGEVSVDGSTE